MRRSLIIVLVLSVTGITNAAVIIDVDSPSIGIGERTFLDVYSDEVYPMGTYYMGITAISPGDGIFDIDDAVPAPGWEIGIIDDPDGAEILGVRNQFILMSYMDVLPPIEPPIGAWVDDIGLTGADDGLLTLLMFDSDFNLVVSAEVLVTPEPMVIVLLGLGGLMLRRRR